MKFAKLSLYDIDIDTHNVEDVIATTKKRKDGSYNYYIKHGCEGSKLGYWSSNISISVATPDKPSDLLKMIDHDYILKPIRKNGEVLKDVVGNIIYIIVKDYSISHKSDLIVLVDIPVNNYTDGSVEVSGDAFILGTGWNGRDRGDIVYKVPAPIIEITGDCVITIKCSKKDGGSTTRVAKYDYTNMKWTYNIEENENAK